MRKVRSTSRKLLYNFDTYDVCIRHGLETCKERSEEDTHLRSVALLSAIVFYIVEDYQRVERAPASGVICATRLRACKHISRPGVSTVYSLNVWVGASRIGTTKFVVRRREAR